MLLLLCFFAKYGSDIGDLEFVVVVKETTLQGHLFRFRGSLPWQANLRILKTWAQDEIDLHKNLKFEYTGNKCALMKAMMTTGFAPGG
jgi:hypothetical protein